MSLRFGRRGAAATAASSDTGIVDTELGPVRRRAIAADADADNRYQPAQVSKPHHRKLQLQLHTAGTYGVQGAPDTRLPSDFDAGEYGRTHHRLFNHVEQRLIWKPWLSGAQGRGVQLLVLLAVAGCHAMLVRKASNEGSSVLADFGPPALGIILAKVTIFITVQELRRTSMQCPHISEITSLNRRYLYSLSCVVALVIAPLLSLPIQPSARFAKVYWGALSPRCFTLDRLADHIQGSFPKAVNGPGSDPLLTNPASAFSSWSASIDPTWQFLPADEDFNITGSLELAGPSSPHEDWLWGRARVRYMLGEPFFVPETQPRHPVSAEWYTPLKMLVASLSCDRMEFTPAQYNLSRDSTALGMQAVDADGCGAALSLPVRMLSDPQRRKLRGIVDRYDNFLHNIANGSVIDPLFHAKVDLFRPQLAQYAADLRLPSVSILPQWLPARAQRDGLSSSSCVHKYILATSVNPFVAVGEGASPIEIHAASCVIEYGTLKPNYSNKYPATHGYLDKYGIRYSRIHTTHFWAVPFRQRSPPNREIQFSTLNVPGPDLIVDPLKPGIRLPSRMDETLARELPTTRIFDDWHAIQLLEYAFSAVSPEQADSYYPAMAYASDQFLSNIFRKLTVAAGMLPRNCESRMSAPRGSQAFTHLEELTLQQQTWFKYVYRVSLGSAVGLLLVCHVLADDSPSGLPWNASSIAARAAMLSRSSLLKYFSDKGHVPDSLRNLYPVRVGRWASSGDNNAFSWRADTLLNQGTLEPPQHLNLDWQRHSFSSLPIHATPLTVASLLGLVVATVALSYMAMQELVKPVEGAADASPLVPIMLGTGWRCSKPLWLQFKLHIVPAFASISLTTYWCDMVTFFYKARLPWAELVCPNLAKKTLTLDYETAPFPLIKAIRNHHWMLTALIIGAFAILPLPYFTAHAFDTEWSLEDGETLAATKRWTWRHDVFHLTDQTRMKAVLQDSLLSLVNASALPKWSSYREALIPLTLEKTPARTLPVGYVGYWGLETETVRAELQCSTLESEPLFKDGPASRHTSTNFEGLQVHLNGNDSTLDGSVHLTADPCFGQELEGVVGSDLYCSHWELLELVSRGSTTTAPVWMISAARFAGTMKSAYALLCQPHIFVGKGQTKLLSMDGSLHDAFIHAHTPVEELLLVNNMAGDYSRLLNSSAFTTDASTNDWLGTRGLRFDSPTVSTERFRGDILSFMSYRELYRNSLSLENVTSLAELSSLAFSTTFSIAVQMTDFLKVPIDAVSVPVTAQKWREVLARSSIPRFALGYVCVLSLIMVAHIATVRFCKAYRFPIAPEPIENTWFFLYRSPVVKLLERIKSPEDISLKTFYTSVEALGFRYVFDRDSDDATWANARVNAIPGPGVSHRAEERLHGSDPLLSRWNDDSDREEAEGEEEPNWEWLD